jgi:hypothetical protein
MNMIRKLLVSILPALLAACATQSPTVYEKPQPDVTPAKVAQLIWQPLAWSAFAEWQGFDLSAGGQALRTSCKAMARKPAGVMRARGWPALLSMTTPLCASICDNISALIA